SGDGGDGGTPPLEPDLGLVCKLDCYLSAERFARSRATHDPATHALLSSFSLVWIAGRHLERLFRICQPDGIAQCRAWRERHAFVLPKTRHRYQLHGSVRLARAGDLRCYGLWPLGIAQALAPSDCIDLFKSTRGGWPLDSHGRIAIARHRLD